jgi:6-pyruvoyltetrahydropterin/6-carboxytetrahydropterin synthase
MILPPSGRYRVVKTYDHAEGLSAAFRQASAEASHCRFLHGYALAFRFTFMCETLDDRGWCIDFGGLKPLRAWLHETFDHRLLVAENDPERARLEDLHKAGVANVLVLPDIGCESFAAIAFAWADDYVRRQTAGRVSVDSVEVHEHGGNAAIYAVGM